MEVVKFIDLVKKLGYGSTFYWISAENLHTSQLCVQSVNSHDADLIKSIAFELSWDWRYWMDAETEKTIYGITFF